MLTKLSARIELYVVNQGSSMVGCSTNVIEKGKRNRVREESSSFQGKKHLRCILMNESKLTR